MYQVGDLVMGLLYLCQVLYFFKYWNSDVFAAVFTLLPLIASENKILNYCCFLNFLNERGCLRHQTSAEHEFKNCDHRSRNSIVK